MLKKVSPLLAGICAIVACSTVQAAPPSTPEVSNTSSFEGYVDPECSLDIPSTSSASGNPIDYTIVSTPAGGTNIDIDEYQGVENTFPTAALEERAIGLEATDSFTVDCNTDTVEIAIALDSFDAPDYTNAENIDIDNLTHDVVLSDPINGDVFATSGIDNTADASTNGLPTNLDGDLELTVASTITATGEELASGKYGAVFTVTVIGEEFEADDTTADI